MNGDRGTDGRLKNTEMHKDIMDTIHSIELMEKRWREAEANRHMEQALELEKEKVRAEASQHSLPSGVCARAPPPTSPPQFLSVTPPPKPKKEKVVGSMDT